MGIESLLLPTIAGYLVLVRLDYSKPRVLKASGYNVAFLSAATGLLLFSLAWTLLFFLDSSYSVELDLEALFEPLEKKDGSFLVQTYCLTFVLALLGPPAIDYPWRYLASCVDRVSKPRDLGERRAAESSGDAIGRLLQDAADTGKHVQLNLASGKVYVGQPATRLDAHGGFDRDAALIPVVSGYRDPKSRELQLDTDYAWVKSDLHGDVRIFVPRREIVLARMFDLEAYELWLLVQDGLVQLDDMLADSPDGESTRLANDSAVTLVERAIDLPVVQDRGPGRHRTFLASPRIRAALCELRSDGGVDESDPGRERRRIRTGLEMLRSALRQAFLEGDYGP